MKSLLNLKETKLVIVFLLNTSAELLRNYYKINNNNNRQKPIKEVAQNQKQDKEQVE